MAHMPFFDQIGVSPGAMPGDEAAFTAILAQVHPRQFMACELARGDRCLFDYTRTQNFYHVDCLIACVVAHTESLMQKIEHVRLFGEFRKTLRPDVPPALLLLLFLKGFMLKRDAPVHIENGATFRQTAGSVFLSKKEKMDVAEMFNGDHFGADDFGALYDALFCRGQIDPQ